MYLQFEPDRRQVLIAQLIAQGEHVFFEAGGRDRGFAHLWVGRVGCGAFQREGDAVRYLMSEASKNIEDGALLRFSGASVLVLGEDTEGVEWPAHCA